METKFSRTFILAIALSLSFSTFSIAQTRHFENSQVKRESDKEINAKRQIIIVLFSNIFRGESSETISLSTKNIPLSLQANFPKLSNLTTEFVAQDVNLVDNCPFEFHSFSVSRNKATLSFGDCSEGLGYNFEKKDGQWRFASLAN